jgi:hypothetical protein
MKAFNEATGKNLTMDSNAVRGTDANRSFAYRDSEGKEQVYTAEYMASTIAAAEALKKLDVNAQEATARLGALSDIANSTGSKFAGVDEAIKNMIVGKDFSGMDMGQLNTLKSEVGGEDNVATTDESTAYLEELASKTNTTLEQMALDAGYSGENAAANYVKAFTDNLNIDIEKETAFQQNSGITGIEKADLTDVSKLMENQNNAKLGPLGEAGGKAYVDGINEALKDLDTDEAAEALKKLANMDVSNWNLDAGISSL